MNKAELIDRVAGAVGVEKNKAEGVLDAFFSTNARAPLRIALTTEFSSSYIERMMTFTLGQWRSSSVVASMPFIPGSPMSISTMSGGVFLQSCTASAPFSASSVAYPSRRRLRASVERMFFSSSAIRMVGMSTPRTETARI